VSSKPSLLQKLQPKFQLGQKGEQLAATFLIQQKYTIVGRNVRWKQLEVVIIAIDHGSQELVFVEVKTRSNSVVPAYLAVGRRKLQALQRFAALYTAKKHPQLSYRIDVITIIETNINHYKNISWWQ
jgi:putative endonuclease